jgi:hypothetical protein
MTFDFDNDAAEADYQRHLVIGEAKRADLDRLTDEHRERVMRPHNPASISCAMPVSSPRCPPALESPPIGVQDVSQDDQDQEHDHDESRRQRAQAPPWVGRVLAGPGEASAGHASADATVAPACAIGASRHHESEGWRMTDDQPRDLIADHVMRQYDPWDPWERDAELASSALTIPSGGPPVVVIVKTDPGFTRPSAVVS